MDTKVHDVDYGNILWEEEELRRTLDCFEYNTEIDWLDLESFRYLYTAFRKRNRTSWLQRFHVQRVCLD
jgi:hypothetical protein